MILRQFLHDDPVAISYLVACPRHAAGAVVAPVGDIARYVDAAAKACVRIRYVFDTHLHADHISTARALARTTGADYVLHESAAAGFRFHAVRLGDVLPLGN